MKYLTKTYGDKIVVRPVNNNEPLTTVFDYIQDTGIGEPVILDSHTVGGCWSLPGGDNSLYQHFRDRVGDPYADPPFPMQVIIGPDGTFALLQRYHNMEAVTDALDALLEGK